MSNFKTLTHGIHCIDAMYIRGDFAAIYLIQQGDEVAIIETGTTHSLANVVSCMSALNISPSQVKYVIPTHIHLDHAGGASGMLALFDQAQLIVHPRGARHMINPEKLIAGSIAVYGAEKFAQLYGEIKPIDEKRVEIAENLDKCYLESRELLFIDTPGHARHHFCIYDDLSRGIFSGDTFGLCYPPLKSHPRGLIPTTTPVHFDPVGLHQSIDKLMEYKPEWIYLTHYAELPDPASHAPSLKQWVDQFVEVCENTNPLTDEGDAALELALSDLILSELDSDTLDKTSLHKLLGVDIKLSAQGMAFWWKQQHG